MEVDLRSPALRNMIHVEVLLDQKCTLRYDIVKQFICEYLIRTARALLTPNFAFKMVVDENLSKFVRSIDAYYEPKYPYNQNSSVQVTFTSSSLPIVHIYQLNDDEGEEELEDSGSSACQQWALPATSFQGIWDSLIFEETIKSNLLDYVSTTLLFSDMKVDSNIISWNRVVLLHGPPGTGKTSLCKALAQKLSVRLSDRYKTGQLIEINSHSLFSRWFSESGKLVMKMFAKIKEMVDEEDCLVCVLIDEVESLTAARKAAMSGTEPSDAIRVVNALLTQIDQLRNHSNVIILTTSNITGAIDLAFVDRADIKQFIGLPSIGGRYHILSSCMNELIRVGIISPRQNLMDYNTLNLLAPTEGAAISLKLLKVCERCEGLSGRALKKLPFLAHAFFVQGVCNLDEFLGALSLAVDKEVEGRSKLNSL